MNELLDVLIGAVQTETLHLVVLSRPRKKGTGDTSKISIRPVRMGDGLVYQASKRIGAQEFHENIPANDLRRNVADWIGNAFDQANLFTSEADFEFRRKGGRETTRRSKPTHKNSTKGHDKVRQYLIPDNKPCPFLIATGIMSKSGKVRASKQKKFRQINRYLDIVNDVVKHLPAERTTRVVDFGCGRSYLTFALHHLFVNVLGRSVEIVGLDLKAKVIEDCNRLAKELDCEGLEFRQGDIAQHESDGQIDLCVSLHACDTATDEALGKSVMWQSSVILAVPCCHHELAAQLDNSDQTALLRHGIMRDRYAALATDALRARALDALGYRTQVIEFIDTEHTPKNLMIRAVRKNASDSANSALEDYWRFRASLGIESFHLETVTDLSRRKPGSL